MKVGILTISHTLNYGAELQAYALRKVISEEHPDVEVINYVCPRVERREVPRSPSAKHMLRHPVVAVREIRDLPNRRVRAREFSRFSRDMIGLGPRLVSQEEIGKRYDAIVVGSDQVWSLSCTGGDDTFFLGSVPRGITRKLSYAASFGGYDIPAEKEKTIGAALRDFEVLSVREAKGVQIIRRVSGRGAIQVLDPTLLLDRGAWGALCNSELFDEGYVFAYVVAERENTLRFAREASRSMGLPLAIVDCYGAPGFSESDCYINDASPEEFLALIRGASLVVTSSFHGLALSLALESEVRYSLNTERANANSRLEDLARRVGIEDHEITKGLSCEPINYRLVRARLEEMRKDSKQFILSALRSLPQDAPHCAL